MLRPAFVTIFFPMSRQPLGGLGRLIFRGFTITLRHTTLGRTALDKGPARRRDLYLTTHNTHNRQTSMPPVRFEPTILVSERPQTHVLDRTATGIGCYDITHANYSKCITNNFRSMNRMTCLSLSSCVDTVSDTEHS
jgi:hypothetical protein